jgi:hypothetical protein
MGDHPANGSNRPAATVFVYCGVHISLDPVQDFTWSHRSYKDPFLVGKSAGLWRLECYEANQFMTFLSRRQRNLHRSFKMNELALYIPLYQDISPWSLVSGFICRSNIMFHANQYVTQRLDCCSPLVYVNERVH